MPEAAIDAWEQAPSDKRCKIESLADLARAVVAAQSGAGADAAELPDLAGLIRLIFRADECSARGDLERARLMLDRAWIRNLREVQTLARLADIYLATPVNAESPSYFRAASLLAEFSEVGTNDFRFAKRLWLGERTWENDRISPLVARAKAWLDEQ